MTAGPASSRATPTEAGRVAPGLAQPGWRKWDLLVPPAARSAAIRASGWRSRPGWASPGATRPPRADVAC